MSLEQGRIAALEEALRSVIHDCVETGRRDAAGVPLLIVRATAIEHAQEALRKH